jgi:clan AA aspartic protease (TIGR02281 family)
MRKITLALCCAFLPVTVGLLPVPSAFTSVLLFSRFLSPMLPACAEGGGGDIANAVAAYNQGQYQQCVNLLEKVVKTGKADANSYYYLACAYQKIGKLPKARALFSLLSAKYSNTTAGAYARQALSQGNFSGASSGVTSGMASSGISGAGSTATARALVAASGSGANSRRSSSESSLPAEYTPDEEKVPIRVGNNGHVHVNAIVNGHSMEFMFDTGAEVCCLSLSEWLSLGLPRPTQPPDTGINGVGGVMPAWSMRAPVQLGKVKRNAVFLVAESVPPLLGQSFFQDLQVNLERRSGYVHLMKKGTSARNIPYNTMDVPFRKAGNNLLVTVNVNGRPIEMFFDTGADDVSMSITHFQRLGLRAAEDATAGMASGAGGSVQTMQTRVDSIELGDIRKYNFKISVMFNNLEHPLLGQSFFGDRRFVIDNEKGVIHFFR